MSGDALSDNQIHDRLTAAREALGDAPGQTVAGNTAMEAARRILNAYALALLVAGERRDDDGLGVTIPSDGAFPPPPR